MSKKEITPPGQQPRELMQSDLLSSQISGQQNRIIAIFGQKGRGKTQLILLTFLPQLRGQRLIIFDPHQEYTQPWITRAIGLEELKEYLNEHSDDKQFAVCFTPDHTDDIPYFVDLCFAMSNCWIIFEEVNMRDLGNVRQPSPAFVDLVNFGRNKSISMITTAKRPAQVSRELTSQADVIISFKQTEPLDIDYLKEFAGPQAEAVVTGLGDHDWAIIYPAPKIVQNKS